MGFFDFFNKKKKITINFDSKDLTESEKIKSLHNYIAYMKGIEARRVAEESKKRESEKEVDEEKQKAEELNLQAEELKKEDIEPFSLFRLMEYQRNKKNKIKVNFTTFDGKSVLGPVEDFVIMPDGGLGVVSGSKVIWASKDISHVFYWIAGLNNFAKNRIIPLCVKSDGQFTPNLMVEEVSELVRTSDGKFRINRFNKKPMYEELAEKEEEINEIGGELKSAESTIAGQQKEIREKSREAHIHKIRADKSESELTMALNKVAEIEMANGEIVRQNMMLVSLKEINEKLIESFENLVNKWSGKIEQKFDKTVREEEWEELKSKLNWAKQNMPQTIYQMPEKEEKPTLSEMTKPEKV